MPWSKLCTYLPNYIRSSPYYCASLCSVSHIIFGGTKLLYYHVTLSNDLIDFTYKNSMLNMSCSLLYIVLNLFIHLDNYIFFCTTPFLLYLLFSLLYCMAFFWMIIIVQHCSYGVALHVKCQQRSKLHLVNVGWLSDCQFFPWGHCATVCFRLPLHF